MPLTPGKSKAAFAANLRELAEANKGRQKPRSLKQRLAIAYAEQARGKRT